MSDTSGISSLTGTQSIWGVTQCRALPRERQTVKKKVQGWTVIIYHVISSVTGKDGAPLARQAIQAPAHTSGSADMPGNWNPMMRLLFCTYHKKAEDKFSSWNENYTTLEKHWTFENEDVGRTCCSLSSLPTFQALSSTSEAHQSPSQEIIRHVSLPPELLRFLVTWWFHSWNSAANPYHMLD